MNVLTRGVRNAFRNTIRTASIVIILGLSIGLALAMLVARASVQDKITEVKSTIGNVITITPAGAQGFQGGGEPLKTEQLQKVADVANITKVLQTLSDRLTSDNSSLQSAIEPGSLGQRNADNSGVGFMAAPQFEIRSEGGSEPDIVRTFSPPVLVTGANDLSDLAVYNADSVTYTSGKAFDASKDEDVAVVGKSLAEKNSLQVGSTFTAYGKNIKVVGIYDAGNMFANGNLIMPLAALQRLSDQAGSVTSATATVNSIENVDAAVSKVESILGDTADIASSKDTAVQAVEPLESVANISLFSLIGALVAGAVIILLTMIMIVRERRREIGVFKAIGASNTKVVLQFVGESVTLTLLGMVAGVIIGAAAAGPVTELLVNNSTSTTNASTAVPGGPQTVQIGPGVGSSPAGGRGSRLQFSGFRNLGNNTLTNVRNVQTSVGTEIIAYGFGAAIIIAVVGSALPAFFIAKIRPAEVMRAE